jgi:hypothetical protein
MELSYLSSLKVERYSKNKHGEIEHLSLQVEHNNNDKEKDRIDWRSKPCTALMLDRSTWLTVKNVAEWLRSGNRQYQKSIKRQN